MEEIIKSINTVYQLPVELELLLRKTARRDAFGKKHKLLRTGQPCTRLYFIEQGLLRLYVRHGNKDYCSRFMLEGDIATSVISFFGKAPSVETIETLEYCILWSISWQELQDIYERFPLFRKVGQHFTEMYYCQDDMLKINLLTKSPGEFYDFLLATFPKLVERVPNKYLASSMGITVQTLLAIKRKRQEGLSPH